MSMSRRNPPSARRAPPPPLRILSKSNFLLLAVFVGVVGALRIPALVLPGGRRTAPGIIGGVKSSLRVPSPPPQFDPNAFGVPTAKAAAAALRSTRSPEEETNALDEDDDRDNASSSSAADIEKMEEDLHSFLLSTDPSSLRSLFDDDNGVPMEEEDKDGAEDLLHSFLESFDPSPSTLDSSKSADKDEEGEPAVRPPLVDSDFVFVAGRAGNPSPGLSFAEKDLYRDPSLRILSSELPIWEHLRKDDMEEEFDPKGLPLNLLLERTWDTAEDIYTHLRRIPYERGVVQLSQFEELTRKTVIILGSGWAAHALMKVADTNKLRLIVVSPSNHFVFTPMLASAAVGTVEYRSMTESVRAANPMIDQYLEGKAVGLDVAKQTVTVKMSPLLEDFDESEPPTLTVPYDHLVVSVGSRVDDRGVPGAADRALTLKSTDDARKLRMAIGECCEYASRPDVRGDDEESVKERGRRVTFLIVGGGPTGVELAGELHDLFEDVTRPHKGTYPDLADSVRVVLAHGGPALVPQFDDNLRSEALASLQKKGVEVILNARVTEVGDGFARLSTRTTDPTTGQLTDEREESILPVGLTVWCAGTAPVPFVEDLLGQLHPDARNDDGRVRVDRYMRPRMKDPEKHELGSILVLGDAAAFEEHPHRAGELLPATAQVAGQQGAYVARLLSRGYDLTFAQPRLPCEDEFGEMDEATCNVFYDPAMNEWLRFRGLDRAPPFGFLNLGMLAYLGGGEALSQVQIGEFPVLAWAGSVAFVLWRSVYLVKQVATRNRMLVTFDWIKSVLFGRDMTRL